MSTFKEKYFEIINNRKAHPLADGVFGEMHHIWPKSLGGSNDEDNLVKLTPQEHYDCHELLPFVYLEEGDINGYQKMMYAWNQISHTREGLVINAEQYAELRERFAVMNSEAQKGKHLSDDTKRKIGEAGKGKKLSDDTKRKISEAKKGKKCTDDTKRKISEASKDKHKGENNGMFGKQHSDETKKKISEAMKGKPSPNKGKHLSDYAKRKISEANSKPFEIDGIRFEQLVDAAKHFKISYKTISNWLHGKTKTDHKCKYI